MNLEDSGSLSISPKRARFPPTGCSTGEAIKIGNLPKPQRIFNQRVVVEDEVIDTPTSLACLQRTVDCSDELLVGRDIDFLVANG